MAGNPLASLPGLPQRPSPVRSAASETRLTQPGIEVARSRKLNSAPTAAGNYPPAKPGALRVLAAQSGWAGTLTRPRNWSHLKVASLAGGDDAATDLRPEVLTPRELPQHEGIPSTPVRQP